MTCELQSVTLPAYPLQSVPSEDSPPLIYGSCNVPFLGKKAADARTIGPTRKASARQEKCH